MAIVMYFDFKVKIILHFMIIVLQLQILKYMKELT